MTDWEYENLDEETMDALFANPHYIGGDPNYSEEMFDPNPEPPEPEEEIPDYDLIHLDLDDGS